MALGRGRWGWASWDWDWGWGRSDLSKLVLWDLGASEIVKEEGCSFYTSTILYTIL